MTDLFSPGPSKELTPLPKPSKKRKRRRKRRPRGRTLSPALTRVAERALSADERDIRTFAPTEMHLAIAEAMLGGAVLFDEIAKSVGVSPACISGHLRDPLVCAWISKNVHSQVRHRLGMVDAAMLRRAIGGDVRAADLLYRRYREMVSRSEHVHRRIDFDPSQLSDADLEKITAEYALRGAKPTEAEWNQPTNPSPEKSESSKNSPETSKSTSAEPSRPSKTT